MGFDNYGLSPQTLKTLNELQFTNPTEIQAKTWPFALKGRDVIGLSQAGTGKTLAFGIPLIECIKNLSGFQALILTPTRELATQIQSDLSPFSFSGKRNIVLLIGGQPYSKQRNQIVLHPNIVVGTPGRIRDFQRQEELDLSSIKILILDEVDRMLDMGFQNQVNDILSHINSECQVLLFSATFNSTVEQLALRITNNPVKFQIGEIKSNVVDVNHEIVELEANWKPYFIDHLLKNKPIDEQWIIFLRSSKRVIAMEKILKHLGHKNFATIYGDLLPGKRTKTMQNFHKGRIEILLSTDITSRGIHVEGLAKVISVELPDDPENFLHRLGRTGRAGSKGHAITMLSRDESPLWKKITQRSKLIFSKIKLPHLVLNQEPIDRLWITEEIYDKKSSQTVKVFTAQKKSAGKISTKKKSKSAIKTKKPQTSRRKRPARR